MLILYHKSINEKAKTLRFMSESFLNLHFQLYKAIYSPPPLVIFPKNPVAGTLFAFWNLIRAALVAGPEYVVSLPLLSNGETYKK